MGYSYKILFNTQTQKLTIGSLNSGVGSTGISSVFTNVHVVTIQ